MSKKLSIGSGILAAAVLVWVLVVRNTAPEVLVTAGDRSFRYSSDPTDVVLKASLGGGYTQPGGSPLYLVYGDGRVEKQRRRQGTVATGHLSSEGLEELLRLAIAGSLMEYENERVEERLYQTLGSHLRSSDAPGTKVELFLTRYTTSDGTESGPVSKVVAAHNVRTRAQFAPEIAEYQALAGIMETLREATR